MRAIMMHSNDADAAAVASRTANQVRHQRRPSSSSSTYSASDVSSSGQQRPLVVPTTSSASFRRASSEPISPSSLRPPPIPTSTETTTTNASTFSNEPVRFTTPTTTIMTPPRSPQRQDGENNNSTIVGHYHGNNINNNNSSNSSSSHGFEKVLIGTHVRVCQWVLRRTSQQFRLWLEFGFLLVSIFGFGVLFVAHVHFIYRGTNAIPSLPIKCLPQLSGIVAPTAVMTDAMMMVMMNENAQQLQKPVVHVTHIYLLSPAGLDGDESSYLTTSNDEGEAAVVFGRERSFVRLRNQSSATSFVDRIPSSSSSSLCESTDRQYCTAFNSTSHTTTNATLLYSFSYTKGFLSLDDATSEKHSIHSQSVYISPDDPQCFGEPLLQFWAHNPFFGDMDTIAWNWLLGWLDHHHHHHLQQRKTSVTDTAEEFAAAQERASDDVMKGFVLHAKTGKVTDLSDYSPESVLHLQLWRGGGDGDGGSGGSSIWGGRTSISWWTLAARKLGVIVSSLLLFFITTTLVSFTLRETQDRMLQFTRALQWHVRHDRPLHILVMKHVLDNLVFCPIMVGIVLFLMETYHGNRRLAFWVLSIVWVSEVFSIVSIRSREGIQFFPKFFFLLFLAFHVYYMSCPFGFHSMALMATSFFMIHSMLLFWNRYELPSVANGSITLEHPRHGMPTTTAAAAAVTITTNVSPPQTVTPRSPSPTTPITAHHHQVVPTAYTNSPPEPQQESAVGDAGHYTSTPVRGISYAPAAVSLVVEEQMTNNQAATATSVSRGSSSSSLRRSSSRRQPDEDDTGCAPVMANPSRPLRPGSNSNLHGIQTRAANVSTTSLSTSAGPPPMQPSVSMGSLMGRSHSATEMSRLPSSHGLFHSDEEEDGSYVYMLNGEVVMHRRDLLLLSRSQNTTTTSTTNNSTTTSSSSPGIPKSVAVVRPPGTPPPMMASRRGTMAVEEIEEHDEGLKAGWRITEPPAPRRRGTSVSPTTTEIDDSNKNNHSSNVGDDLMIHEDDEYDDNDDEDDGYDSSGLGWSSSGSHTHQSISTTTARTTTTRRTNTTTPSWSHGYGMDSAVSPPGQSYYNHPSASFGYAPPEEDFHETATPRISNHGVVVVPLGGPSLSLSTNNEHEEHPEEEEGMTTTEEQQPAASAAAAAVVTRVFSPRGGVGPVPTLPNIE